MECLAEMPHAPLDRRPRKRQRLGWDVGPDMTQIKFCGQEVANAISAATVGLSAGGIVSSQMAQELLRLVTPPLREDDKDGHYVFAVGDNLTSRYRIDAKMGEGTFGQVLECWDRERKEMVAIKIIRGIEKYRDAAMIEIGMLEQLCKYEKSKSSCVQIRNWFDYRNHICIVCEKLGPSLYDFLRKNNYRSFPIAVVREVAKQLLECLAFMHELRLIHTDLKPENILLVSPEYIKVPDYKVSSRSPKEGSYYKRVPKSSAIKVIDFGSTTFDQQDQTYVVSTRHYRAPEVILGLGWSYPCDIWSVGCILVELCTGEALFQTHENLEHLAMMERVLGPLPYHMLKRAEYVAAFIQINAVSLFSLLRITRVLCPYFLLICSRQAEKYVRKGRLNWPDGCASRESMKAVMKLPRFQNLVMENVDRSAGDFIDLLHGLLRYDPARRLTAQEALEHPFLTERTEQRK
ncbi:serine/threonine-protein kinase AFC2 isoform X1 [Brachypodium distachyon]|uniref:serine/threonine-protein kinase AFC2 isoform X1 n=1 Tax=Brachypodium distachyon TaxID=15368 RepID=UPI0001C744D4|nr:serine/threonine-protein kinase AFC2 isoform X1 [Brachypodium distachyon]|eukprot:XP_024318178.1 serine/threonine-protein kinase AFC2 isoform X1 [Brachypodium distachyon]